MEELFTSPRVITESMPLWKSVGKRVIGATWTNCFSMVRWSVDYWGATPPYQEEQMTTLRLSCTGFRLGRLSVPAFQLCESEVVCLHIAAGCDTEQEELTRLLSFGRDTSHLSFFGTVAWAERPMPQRGVLWRWRNPTIMDWLTRSAGVSHDQALEILRRWNEGPEKKIGLVQCNPRTWIALDAAFTRGTDIVVFDTSGNDPIGIRIAYDLVASRLSAHAVIHVSHHYDRVCLPGARCLELPLDLAADTGTGTVARGAVVK